MYFLGSPQCQPFGGWQRPSARRVSALASPRRTRSVKTAAVPAAARTTATVMPGTMIRSRMTSHHALPSRPLRLPSKGASACWQASEQSGWPDSNRRPPAPKAGALTKLRYIPRNRSVAYRPVRPGSAASLPRLSHLSGRHPGGGSARRLPTGTLTVLTGGEPGSHRDARA
jgi:hypothetical protein